METLTAWASAAKVSAKLVKGSGGGGEAASAPSSLPGLTTGSSGVMGRLARAGFGGGGGGICRGVPVGVARGWGTGGMKLTE